MLTTMSHHFHAPVMMAAIPCLDLLYYKYMKENARDRSRISVTSRNRIAIKYPFCNRGTVTRDQPRLRDVSQGTARQQRYGAPTDI